MKHQMELRMDSSELETQSDGSLTVSGYVNKTNKLSEVLGVSKRFREKIAKGVFQRAINNRVRDIDFLAEHNSKKILSSTRNGSLELTEDEQGLYMTATITPTSWGKDYHALINDNILQNMSFGFRTIKDSWRNMGANLYERTIEELELFEVSVVKDPAYSQSTISARSIEVIEEPEIKVEEHKEEKEISLDIHSKQLQLDIRKAKESIQTAERMLNIEPSSSSFKWHLVNEKEKLTGLNEELRNIEKQMEEDKMNEERTLQTTTNNPDVQAIKGTGVTGPIIEKLEHTSSVYEKARKVPFTGEGMKIPYETDLEDAEFVSDEGGFIPESNLNLNDFGELKQKRVGMAMSFSKQLMYDSGGDLSQHVKKTVTKRVAKAVEKSILAGSQPHEFKGVSHDEKVTSSNISTNVTQTNLRELFLKVHEDYAQNSSWYMSRPFFEIVSKIDDGTGNYLVKHIMINNKIVPTLFGYPIEITDALGNGEVIGEIPVLFGSIEDCYTIGVSKEYEAKAITGDTTNALRGSAMISGEFYGDGMVTNHQAITKGVVA